jgi:hypothetical protein
VAGVGGLDGGDVELRDQRDDDRPQQLLLVFRGDDVDRVGLAIEELGRGEIVALGVGLQAGEEGT